jgi:hypothetical protein
LFPVIFQYFFTWRVNDQRVAAFVEQLDLALLKISGWRDEFDQPLLCEREVRLLVKARFSLANMKISSTKTDANHQI